MTTRTLDLLVRQTRPEVSIGAGIALLTILLTGAWFYLVNPSVQEYLRLNQARNQVIRETDVGDATQAQAAIAALDNEIAALRERLYGSASQVPQREVESHVIQSLDRISARRQVELISVKPGQPGRELGFEELPFHVDVMGGYFQLFDWLGDVEAELRPMIVKEFGMSPETRSARVELKLQLVAYRVSSEES